MNQLLTYTQNQYIESEPLSVKSDAFFVREFSQLNNLKLDKQVVLGKFEQLLDWNYTACYFQEEKLQKLWMKLIKAYKFKLEQWEEVAGERNIHSYLVKERGEGLRKLIRFYKDRKIPTWEENAFNYGLKNLLENSKMNQLEVFFITSIICYEDKMESLEIPEVSIYFEDPVNEKTKNLYNCYRAYMLNLNLVTAVELYRLLSKYNPHFNIHAKATPKFYKDLARFIGIV